jgi:nicotinamide mononucleotide (NMN) deamidase PncC
LATEAEEKKLKQAFDEEKAKAEALAGELKSAQENIAVAEKSRSAGIAAQADDSPAGSLDVPGRELAAAREEAKNNELERTLAESTARADKLADKVDKLAKELAAETAANIERVNTVQSVALQAKLAVEAKNKELKQALDDSSVRADKLAKDLAAETAANTRRINALQAHALQAKLATEAEEKKLKQAFDEEKAKAEALAGELKSAQENIAVAEKSRSGGIAAQADVSPTGSFDRAVQSADAAPADAVAGVLRSPSPSLQKASLSSAEEARLVARANSLIQQVDIADARLLLKYGSDKGSARATFMLAETYDSRTLRSLQAYGVSGDTAMARKLYELAAAAGIDQARERLEVLNAKPEH